MGGFPDLWSPHSSEVESLGGVLLRIICRGWGGGKERVHERLGMGA